MSALDRSQNLIDLSILMSAFFSINTKFGTKKSVIFHIVETLYTTFLQGLPSLLKPGGR